MIFKRRTIAQPVSFEGIGLHSGVPVKVTVHPSESGIAFRLGDDRVEAKPENVSDTTRRTKLGPINTIEHLMSAFAGLEITGAEVELDAVEMPGMDGSSKPFVDALLAVGFVDGAEFEVPSLFSRLFPHDDHSSVSIAKGSGHWKYVFETGERWPGTQSYETETIIDSYASEVAPARTTAFSEELEMAAKLGLGKGLDLNSVLILDETAYRNPARFEDEPARHKLLDLAGDLYLAGVPLRALNVVAVKSGHTGNVRAAQMLSQAIWG